MPSDGEAFELRRVQLDAETSVWFRAEAPPAPGPPSSSRVWRVRPAGIALGGVLAAAALLRLGLGAPAVLGAGLLAVLGVLAVIDLESRLLPNRIIGPAALAAVAFQVVLLPDRLPGSLAAGLAAALVFLAPTLVRRGAMGMGDVKLVALLGLALGGNVLAAVMIGSLASVPAALVSLRRNASPRSATLPFGPFLALGAAVTLLA